MKSKYIEAWNFMEVYIIYTTSYLCVQTESCGFIINGVTVKDEENANYYPARRPGFILWHLNRQASLKTC